MSFFEFLLDVINALEAGALGPIGYLLAIILDELLLVILLALLLTCLVAFALLCGIMGCGTLMLFVTEEELEQRMGLALGVGFLEFMLLFWLW